MIPKCRTDPGLIGDYKYNSFLLHIQHFCSALQAYIQFIVVYGPSILAAFQNRLSHLDTLPLNKIRYSRITVLKYFYTLLNKSSNLSHEITKSVYMPLEP